MAVTAQRVAVGTSAVALNTADTSGLQLTVKAVAALSLGPSTVTTANGFEVATGQTVTVSVDAGDVLFGIAAAATTAHVLRT